MKSISSAKLEQVLTKYGRYQSTFQAGMRIFMLQQELAMACAALYVEYLKVEEEDEKFLKQSMLALLQGATFE
jgi:hypothetical protein